MAANLTYYIFEGVLAGTAGGHMFNITALSGGGGGSIVHPGNADTNDAYAQGKKADEAKGIPGGPLPAGRYRIDPPSVHKGLGLSCQLDPFDDPNGKIMGRDGFYIHGRGKLGSYGCIVPMEQFAELMAALAKDRGGVLFVLEAMGGGRFV
jgi:hypothetical protein